MLFHKGEPHVYKFFNAFGYLNDVRCPSVQQIKFQLFLNSTNFDFNLIKNNIKANFSFKNISNFNLFLKFSLNLI